jgi:hypothetical protein
MPFADCGEVSKHQEVVMRNVREYRFELCWMLLLVLLFWAIPVRSSADDRDWEDGAGDCPGSSGWCSAK